MKAFILFRTLLLASLTADVIYAQEESEETNKCVVTMMRCDFPFIFEGRQFTQCTTHNATDSLVCISNHGEDQWSWGICSDECMEEDGVTPMDFGGEMSGMAVFCKNKASPCIFPFTFMGVEYDECTSAEADFLWCATRINEDGSMVENMWGKCDAESCEKDDSSETLTGDEAAINAEVKFDMNNITSDLAFQQADSKSPLLVTGRIFGLEPGEHEISINTQGSAENLTCSTTGGHYNPDDVDHGTPDAEVKHVGDLGPVVADEEGVAVVDLSLTHASLYGPRSVLTRPFVVYSSEDNEPLACGLIFESSSEWPLTLIIIIALSIFIVLLLILIVCLICYCVKRSKTPKNMGKAFDEDGLPLHTGNGGYNKKTPLYDELSIPFIDATPAPTPKLGRSIDRLSSFFMRNPSVGRSRGSLASTEDLDK